MARAPSRRLFYRSIQTARAKKGGAICVGSCAVYRRAALEPNGGMSLAEHSEDLWTGFDLHRLGWRLRYLPVALSTGNCPDNILAFLNQQYRWCSATMSLLKARIFWSTKLPVYDPAVLPDRLHRVRLHGGLHVRGARPGRRHDALRAGQPAASATSSSWRPCCSTSGVIYPMLAPRPFPARGLVGPGHLGLGPRLRALGHAARPAARVAAVRQRRRGTTASSGFWIGLDPVERRHPRGCGPAWPCGA